MASSNTPSKSAKMKNIPPLIRETIAFPPCTHTACFGLDPACPEFNEVSWFLQRTPFQHAFTDQPKMSKFLLGNIWMSCAYDPQTKQVSASVLSTEDPGVVFTVADVSPLEMSTMKLLTYSTIKRTLHLFGPKLPSNQSLK